MTLDPKIKAIGFDMDGTVVNTKVDYGKLGRIFMDEFECQGVPGDIIERHLKTGSLDEGLSWLEANKPEAFANFERRAGDRATEVEMEFADQAKPYPGTRELLEDLRRRGYKTAILTRGGHSYADYILSGSNMLGLFDAVIARDDYPYKEAKPSKVAMEHMCGALGVGLDEVIFLGDGTTDYYTCVNSGTRFIGVETHLTREGWEKAVGPSVETIPLVADLRRYIG
ncbi:MAG: HAD family hydrolase [Candidatus Methanomethylophilus sp.]|nr:HAD family hydrolase [Methanomethylophilus sp.]